MSLPSTPSSRDTTPAMFSGIPAHSICPHAVRGMQHELIKINLNLKKIGKPNLFFAIHFKLKLILRNRIHVPNIRFFFYFYFFFLPFPPWKFLLIALFLVEDGDAEARSRSKFNMRPWGSIKPDLTSLCGVPTQLTEVCWNLLSIACESQNRVFFFFRIKQAAR